MITKPPRLAEALLGSLLKRNTRDSILGDLMEQYVARVFSARGPRAANRWYVGQVLRIVFRTQAPWTALLATTLVARTALDWVSPTTDFELRAAVTTALVVLTVSAAGFAAGRLTGLLRSGPLAAMAAAAFAAGFANAASLVLLAVFPGEQAATAIALSGGLREVFTLPVSLIVPAALFGGCAGALGVVTHGPTLERGIA